MGDVHPLGNPHYWLDPDNGRRIARGIAQKLADVDPGNSQYFQQRFQDFDRRLSAAEKNWDAEMAPYRGIVLLPSVGGEKQVTDYFKLFDYDINLLTQNFKARQ